MSNVRKNGQWNNQGYVQCRIWENGKKRIILQHRLIMEGVLGRRLKQCEDVHHKDGNRKNNAPENLEIMSHSQHSSHTGATRKRECKGVLFKRKGVYSYWVGHKKKNGRTFTTRYYRNKKDALIEYKKLVAQVAEGGK